MKKKMLRKGIILLLLCLVLGSFQSMTSSAKEWNPIPVVVLRGPSAPEQVRVYRYSDTSLGIYWKKQVKADGYVIYKYNSSQKKFKKYKIIAGKKTVLFVDEIGYKKSAKYKVSAYRNMDGKRVIGKQSYAVTARTYKQGDTKVNAGKVVTKIPGDDFRSAEISYYETLQLSSKVKPSRYSKASKKVPLRDTVQWCSSNPSIASVDKNGLVRAKARAGKCYIYTRAHNGRKSNMIAVTVKNYAKPKAVSLWAARENPALYGVVLEMFVNYKKTATDIAEYFYIHRPKGEQRFRCWIEKGEVKMSPENYVSGEMKRIIYNFMRDFPYDMILYVSPYCVDFTELYGINEEYKSAGASVTFLFDDAKSDNMDYTEKYELAPNWSYGYFAGT